MQSLDGPARTQRRRLHGAHLLAMRAAPYVLWVVGILLLLGGVFLERPDDVASSMIFSGVVLVVSGAVLPRAKGFEANKNGVKAGLERLVDLDGNAVEVRKQLRLGDSADDVIATTHVVTEAVATATPHTATLTGAELLAAAQAAGWSIRPRPGEGIQLSKADIKPKDPTRFAVGDSITITLREDLSLPVPHWLLQTLDAAGFTMPTDNAPAAREASEQG